MARKKQTRGACAFCGKEMSRAGMTKHLPSCSAYQEAIASAQRQSGKSQTLYHIVVQDAWGGDFWLHLEMNGNASLADLDTYLRAIWLECCGHLSQFSVGGWQGDEIPMGRRITSVFTPDTTLTHIYDFGTSSETLARVAGVREGKPLTKYPIKLMARNQQPEATCMQCDNAAKWLCIECLYETEESGQLCDEHVKAHPHDEYGEPIPFVNSPRLGMCGYTGPAEPPY